MPGRTASDPDALFAHFSAFAESYPGLTLYSQLAEGLAGDRATASLLLAAQPGQAVPVLLFAAVHDLVLAEPTLPLARWYPSVTGQPVPDGDPYPDFRATCHEHWDRLSAVIATHRTQTNEVNRAVLLAPLLATACADVADRPLAVVELGSSAGLLLRLDRYRVDVGGRTYGDRSSPVRCAGELLRGTLPSGPFPPEPPIADRVGIDLDPVDLADTERVRWLEACLWPDLPERVDRFRAATELSRRHPVRIVTGDYLDAFPDTAATLDVPPDSHLVVFHTWALCYTPRSRRPALAEALSQLADSGRPVSWLSAEPPGCVPGLDLPEPWPPEGTPFSVVAGGGGSTSEAQARTAPDTVLGLRRWRSGKELPPATLAASHPHGAWLAWLG